LKVVCEDYNNITANALIGFFFVDWRLCYENAGKWAVNSVFKLVNDEDEFREKGIKEFGDVHVQMMYVPDGMSEYEKEPPAALAVDAKL
jgi:hypothetical protein